MHIQQSASARGAGGFPLRRVCAAIVIAAPLMAGCRETLTEVESGIVEPGTWPALRIEQTLPRLGDLAEPGRPTAEAAAVVARWEASWDHGTIVGGAMRDGVYRDAGALRLSVDSAAARNAAGMVRAALDEVLQFGEPLPLDLAGRIEVAEQLMQEADMASAVEDWPGAGLNALRAADALRETSPRSAALTLVEGAEDALGPPPSGVGSEPAGRARARRLVWWSRIAIERGQYSLAIQRGYYACLLLDVRPS